MTMVGGVKKALQALIEGYQQIKWIVGEENATGVLETLERLDDSSPLAEEERKLLEQMVKNSWLNVINTLEPAHWQSHDKILPLRQFQKWLESEKIIPPNYHHPFCFAEIITRFNDCSTELKGDAISALVKSTCRAIGYVEQAEINSYPLDKLTSRSQNKSPTVESNLKASVTAMAVLFYLLYYKVRPPLRALIPFLSYYRMSTTDEERCSELALLSFLGSSTVRDVVQQIGTLKDFIDYSELMQNKDIKALKHLLPASRPELMKTISPDQWHFKANQNSSLQDLVTRTVLLSNAITDQFVASKIPFKEIQEFCGGIMQQAYLISDADNGLLDYALRLFKLQQYRLQRECEGSHRECHNNIWSFFSGETKRSAAMIAEQKLLGVPVKFNLVQWLAAHQGRLKELQEKEEVPIKGLSL